MYVVPISSYPNIHSRFVYEWSPCGGGYTLLDQPWRHADSQTSSCFGLDAEGTSVTPLRPCHSDGNNGDPFEYHSPTMPAITGVGGGWYRFTCSGGDRMPVLPLRAAHMCGTNQTAWLASLDFLETGKVAEYPRTPSDGVMNYQICLRQQPRLEHGDALSAIMDFYSNFGSHCKPDESGAEGLGCVKIRTSSEPCGRTLGGGWSVIEWLVGSQVRVANCGDYLLFHLPNYDNAYTTNAFGDPTPYAFCTIHAKRSLPTDSTTIARVVTTTNAKDSQNPIRRHDCTTSWC